MQKFISYYTVFDLLYFVFEGTFPVQAPRGLYSEGRINKGFLHYEFEGLIFGRAYNWRDLFSEFYGMLSVTTPNVTWFILPFSAVSLTELCSC